VGCGRRCCCTVSAAGPGKTPRDGCANFLRANATYVVTPLPCQALYNTDVLGYPTRGGKDAAGRPAGSSNFSLHRAVQTVLTAPEFRTDHHVTDGHVEEIAK
jgi:hypothetical protein